MHDTNDTYDKTTSIKNANNKTDALRLLSQYNVRHSLKQIMCKLVYTIKAYNAMFIT